MIENYKKQKFQVDKIIPISIIDPFYQNNSISYLSSNKNKDKNTIIIEKKKQPSILDIFNTHPTILSMGRPEQSIEPNRTETTTVIEVPVVSNTREIITNPINPSTEKPLYEPVPITEPHPTSFRWDSETGKASPIERLSGYNLTQNQKYIGNKLMNGLNLTSAQVLGLLANIEGESLSNPNAENKAEKAGQNPNLAPNQAGIGLIQWSGPRHDKFVNYTSKFNGKSDLNTQLDYMIQEIKNDFPEYWKLLKQARTPEESAKLTYAMYVAGTKQFGNDNLDEILPELETTASTMENNYSNLHQRMYGKRTHNLQDRIKWVNEHSM